MLRGLPIALYTSPLGVEDRRLHFTNDSIERITGFSREAFAQANLWESRLEAEDRNRILADLRTVSEVGAVALEYRWRNADGTERHILDQIAVNCDESGTAVELFGMWFDVTERKELELSLQHASKLEAVGRLTGGIAHDFNNMLSIVIGNLDLMKGSLQGNEKALRRVESAIDGAHRCAELTSRLLAFSRRSPLQPRELDFTSFIPGLIKLLERTLGERITISATVEPNLPEVCVDHAQLEAALINLAVNARDAMPDGGTLSICIQCRDAPAAGCVDDSSSVEMRSPTRASGCRLPSSPGIRTLLHNEGGPGREPASVSAWSTASYSRVVELSLSTAALTRVPDLLSTLPALVSRSSTSQDIDPGMTAGAPNPINGAGKAVLVVEDDADVRSTVVSTLETLAFRVLSAQDGSEALRLLQMEANIALVFSDVNMPGATNGIELGHAIRQRWPQMPILLTSGYLREDQDTNGFELLQKPYRASDLVEMLRSLLGDSREDTILD